MKNQKIEIFSGTGGVGKTTLAASRASFLAAKSLNVLLITIDPSKRLKQLLGLDDSTSGEVVNVCDPFSIKSDVQISAMLMNPSKTMQRISKASNCPDLNSNRIVQILSRPNGGLNEILSLIEVNFRLEENKYDKIILDTPPGSHFLDFLESANKIESFFDKKFIEIFKFISERDSVQNTGRFAMKFISKGIAKLIGYLENVTGASFVQDFVEAISIIYKASDIFKNAISLKNKMTGPNFAKWFLVTSIDQHKLSQAIDLQKTSSEFLNNNEMVVLLNKSLHEDVKTWTPQDDELIQLKNSMVEKEQILTNYMNKNFKNVFSFNEIISEDPIIHVKELTNQWEIYNG
ncbi:MAG: AAA family ATPase [Bacteriovoracaceae bacterium]|nr:AAA family ATPase [Bacteriovoracaceae bacterium]